ncbi:hypothetical protein ACFL6U_25585 [Planctomycetota bacterium]
MNQHSDTIPASPVKRLLGLYFEKPSATSTYQTYGEYYDDGYGGGSQLEVSQKLPYYIMNPSEALMPSFTGRMSNSDIDVIHFGLEVIVEADDVLSFMKELNRGKEHTFKGWDGEGSERTFKHNQITILSSETKPVVRNDPLHRYCKYGPQAVVHLKLVCEYIFERDAYEEIKPAPVKNELNDDA